MSWPFVSSQCRTINWRPMFFCPEGQLVKVSGRLYIVVLLNMTLLPSGHVPYTVLNAQYVLSAARGLSIKTKKSYVAWGHGRCCLQPPMQMKIYLTRLRQKCSRARSCFKVLCTFCAFKFANFLPLWLSSRSYSGRQPNKTYFLTQSISWWCASQRVASFTNRPDKSETLCPAFRTVFTH